MKSVDLPISTAPGTSSIDRAESVSSSSAESPPQDFSELMGQAMALAASPESTPDASEAPAENNSPDGTSKETKAAEAAPVSSVEMLAAMMLPMVQPATTVTVTSTSDTSSDAVAPVASEPAPITITPASTAISTGTNAGAEAKPSTRAQGQTPAPAPTPAQSESVQSQTAPDQELSRQSLISQLTPRDSSIQSATVKTDKRATAAEPATAPKPEITQPPVSAPAAAIPVQAAANPTEVSISNSTELPVSDASKADVAKLPVESTVPQAPTNAPAHPASTTNAAPTPSNALPETAEQKLPDTGMAAADSVHVSEKAEISAQTTAGIASSAPISSRGTSGAKYPLPMQKAEKMNDFAGPAEQNLPVTAEALAGQVLPSKAIRPIASDWDSEKSGASLAIGSSPADPSAAKEVKAPAESAAIANPVRTVERTHDLMALHALRLRDSGNDSMQVVIKPSADLHIALNLEMRDGTVQVNAQLQRGDYEFLNRHWSDLQQQMEARGVKLAPLSNQNQPSGNNGNFSQQPGRQPSEEKATRTGAFAEFALAGIRVPKSSTKSAAARGWESWA